jgi:hypothetical protein
MQEIMGSVDNAWTYDKRTKVCHLVFMKNSMVECQLVNRKELSNELKDYIKSDPLTEKNENKERDYKLASGSRQEHKKIIEEAEAMGMDMEKSLDSDMEKDPDLFQVHPYEDIKKVSLVLGQSGNSPKLTIETNSKPLEYRLMHNSYEGDAKLDEVALSKYKSVLKKVFVEKFEMD